MILERYEKQPAELKDYDIDYAEWLAPVSDTLNTVGAAVTSDDEETPALTCNAVFVSPTSAKFWVAGGTAGVKYKLTATATTYGGRVDQSELVFTVKDY
jgi:hypothetical protein